MGKGAQTRQTIVERALAETSRAGIHALSIGGLAEAVGMSKSGLFAHFKSKQDLQLEVFRAAVERFRRTVVVPAFQEPRGLPRVRALFESWLRWAHQPAMPGGCVFITLCSELNDQPGPIRDQLIAYENDWTEGLARAARIAVHEGHFREDADPMQFAFDFHSLILAHNHYHLMMRDPDAEARTRAAFERILSTYRS